jgi:hypothetical protein
MSAHPFIGAPPSSKVTVPQSTVLVLTVAIKVTGWLVTALGGDANMLVVVGNGPAGVGAAGSMGPTVALVAGAVPRRASFDAVTVTLKFCPTSADVSVIGLPFWPSDHTYEYPIGVSPDHVPGSTASWSPRCGFPEIVGGMLFVGATGSAQAGAATRHELATVERTATHTSRRAPPLRREWRCLCASTRY